MLFVYWFLSIFLLCHTIGHSPIFICQLSIYIKPSKSLLDNAVLVLNSVKVTSKKFALSWRMSYSPSAVMPIICDQVWSCDPCCNWLWCLRRFLIGWLSQTSPPALVLAVMLKGGDGQSSIYTMSWTLTIKNEEHRCITRGLWARFKRRARSFRPFWKSNCKTLHLYSAQNDIKKKIYRLGLYKVYIKMYLWQSVYKQL